MVAVQSRMAPMIAEPIEIDAPGCPSQRDFILANRGSAIFIVRNGASKCLVHSMVHKTATKQNYCDSAVQIVYFSIVKQYGDRMYYYILSEPTRDVDKEQFIDFVSANYPDHFEWLLFHPEWL